MSVIIIFFTSTNIFSENIINFLTNETGDRVLKYTIKIPVSNRTGVINFVFGRSIVYEKHRSKATMYCLITTDKKSRVRVSFKNSLFFYF